MSDIDVEVESATLMPSKMTDRPIVRLVLTPLEPLFVYEQVQSKLFCVISQADPSVWRRQQLRQALGWFASNTPFTEGELEKMIGRRLRVYVQEEEFQGMTRVRTFGFDKYTGTPSNRNYSDNEYVAMIHELETNKDE